MRARKRATPRHPRFNLTERWTIVLLAVFSLAAIFSFLLNLDRCCSIIKIPSPLLAFAVPEILEKRGSKRHLRVFLACVPLLIFGALELRHGLAERAESSQKKLADLKEQELRTTEANFADQVLVYPGDVANGVSEASQGFEAEARRTQIHAVFQEALLLQGCPELARSHPVSTGAVADAISNYMQVKAQLLQNSSPADSRAIVDKILLLLTKASEYERASAFMQTHLVNAYLTVASNAQNASIESARDGLRSISRQWVDAFGLRPVAGVCNHLGTISLGYNSREDAFRWIYQSLADDPEHLSTLESIAFALWAKNQDAKTGLSYAKTGLQLSTNFVAGAATEIAKTLDIYLALQASNTNLAAEFQSRSTRVATFYSASKTNLETHEDYFVKSFKTLVCYLEAIELLDEHEARRYAKELFDACNGDLDVTDTYGFVLMRFAANLTDIQTAKKYFLLVREKAAPGSQILRDLATTHYAAAVRKLEAVSGK